MDCVEVKKLIELYVLGELAAAQQDMIRAHLRDCASCRAVEQGYHLLLIELKRAVPADLPRLDFSRNLQAVLDREIRKISRRYRRVHWLTVASSVAACLALGGAIWWFYLSHAVPSELPAAPERMKLTPISAPPAVLHTWQYNAAQSVTMSRADEIVIRGNDMYLLFEREAQSHVAAMDIRTGRQKWLSESRSCGFLAADDARVYCLTPSGAGKFDLIALDRRSGQTMWRYPQSKAPTTLQRPCTPTVLPGNRICWTADATVHTLNASTGKTIWSRSFDQEKPVSEAAFGGDSVYIAHSEGLYCLDVNSGDELWRLAYEGKVLSWQRPLLSAAEGYIYAALPLNPFSYRLICWQLKNRRLMWDKTVPRMTHMCVTEANIYLRSQNIQAWDRTTGELLWDYPATGCGPLTMVDGLICFVDSAHQGRLVALSEHTGKKVWERHGLRSCNALVKVGSTGYLKTLDGTVHVMALGEKSTRW